jgi:hypothetical protein
VRATGGAARGVGAADSDVVAELVVGPIQQDLQVSVVGDRALSPFSFFVWAGVVSVHKKIY